MAENSPATSGGPSQNESRSFSMPKAPEVELQVKPVQENTAQEQVNTTQEGAEKKRHGIKLGLAKAKSDRAAAKTDKPTRKAALRIARVNPWSVMKTSFLFSVVGAVAVFIAVWILWGVISASGMLNTVQQGVSGLVGADNGSGNSLTNYVNLWRVLGFTAVISVVNIVLITVICTLFSFLYNVASGVIGGIEVTLAEN